MLQASERRLSNSRASQLTSYSTMPAVNMVMRSLAIDLAPRGINCVVINPGWVQTDMGGQHARLSFRGLIRTKRSSEGIGGSTPDGSSVGI